MTVLAAAMLTAGAAQAQHVWEDSNGWWNSHFTMGGEAPKYTDNEFSLDLFASYLHSEGKFDDLLKTDITHEGSWGGGAGINYFPMRWVGVGGDFNMSDKPHEIAIDQFQGNLFLRLPIGNTGLAPYAIGTGGRTVTPFWSWVYGGGAGLEFRFNHTTGIFADGRFFWSEKGTDFNRLLIRAGLRLAF